MPGQWQNEGINRVLNIIFGAQAVDATLYLGLHKNAAQPAVTAVLADLTEPLTGYGYARLPLTRNVWVVAGNVATYAAQTFTASGGDFGLVYGSFICTSLTGTTCKLVSLDYLYSPIYVAAAKGIQIVPTILV